jgi:hypothetical protein
MKIQSIISAGFIAILSMSFVAQAQTGAIEVVKILPSTEKGIIKILFAHEPSQNVEVRFYNEDGLLKKDRIKASTFKKGFIKKYDVSAIDTRKFSIDIDSESVSATYRLVESKGGKSYTALLERASYTQSLVASNK